MEGIFQTGTFLNKKLKLLQDNLCVPLKGKLREFCHLGHSLTLSSFFFSIEQLLIKKHPSVYFKFIYITQGTGLNKIYTRLIHPKSWPKHKTGITGGLTKEHIE